MFNGKVLPEFPDWLPEDHAGLSRWLNEITNRATPRDAGAAYGFVWKAA